MRYQTSAYYRRARRNAAIADLKSVVRPYAVVAGNFLAAVSIFSFVFILSLV